MESSTALLEVAHVTKEYRGGVRANDDISFAVHAGEVCGLLGHNGAGKTTLLNQVIGLVRPTSGSIRVLDHDAVADPAAARMACSFQPQAQTPIDGLTPRQAIELMARIRGADRQRARRRAAELLAALDIQEWADRIGDQLSGGVKRLTAFAMAAAEPGRVVMFDEPTNDVDPVRRGLMWDQLRILASDGCAVLLVTHNLVEAERAVDRLAILDRGRMIAYGTPAQLRGETRGRLRMEITAADSETASKVALTYSGAASGRRLVADVVAADVADAIPWIQQMQADGEIEEFTIAPISLHDVYVRLVGTENPATAGHDRTGVDDATLGT